MRRLLEVAAFVAAILISSPAVAQDEPPPWQTPLQGVETLFGERRSVGVMVVTPADDEHSEQVAELLREKLLSFDFVEVVMDDAPLGPLGEKSDEEIIELAGKYPVDVVFVIRSFPGKEGPTAVMRVEMVGEGTLSFRLSPRSETTWRRPPAEEAREIDPLAHARHRTEKQARKAAALMRMSAVGASESHRLVFAEQRRKLLSFEETGAFGYVLDSEGERLDWPDAYGRLGDEELLASYRTRRTVRLTAFAGGGILAAAGVGLMFVGLGNQLNCSGASEQEGCGRPGVVGAGVLTAGAGVIGIVIGSLVSPHPVPSDEVRRRVERHNESLTK